MLAQALRERRSGKPDYRNVRALQDDATEVLRPGYPMRFVDHDQIAIRHTAPRHGLNAGDDYFLVRMPRVVALDYSVRDVRTVEPARGLIDEVDAVA